MARSGIAPVMLAAFDESGRLWLLGRIDGKAGGLFPFGVKAEARYWPGVVHAALVTAADQPILAIEGDADSRQAWQREAYHIGPDARGARARDSARPTASFEDRLSGVDDIVAAELSLTPTSRFRLGAWRGASLPHPPPTLF